jgi:crotonobetainyl-CoA:carnitine CoA-transferase CaiB-like acyl-CoA transferase
MSESTASDGLLSGLRVIDLSLWQPGHVATQLLADLGADVLKVEPPGGDRMRSQVGQFVNFNGRKRSMVLDLKRESDRLHLLELVAGAEVVVENYRPGVADRLGVGFEQLSSAKPAIVLCSISGFGQSSRLANVPGHDHSYQAFAGAFTFPEGRHPEPAGLMVGDQGAGLAAAFAILAAVIGARRTGEGEHIDVAITDLLAAWVAPYGAIDERYPASPRGSDLPGMGTFATADQRYVELGVYSENHLWDLLCETLGINRSIGMPMHERTTRSAELRAALASEIVRWRRDDLVSRLLDAGVPVAPVLTRAEMMAHPHFRERGLLTTGPDGLRRVSHPVQYAIHPALPPGMPPALDESANRVTLGSDLAPS